MPADQPVWDAFITRNRFEIQQVWYDLHVGQPVEIPEGSPQWLYKVALGVTRKRIDVVCQMKNRIMVIEVKPVCNMASLGQALTYSKLLVKEYQIDKNVLPAVLCLAHDDDLVEIAENLGVKVIVEKDL